MATGLVDIQFGLVSSGSQFPVVLSPNDTVGDVILIALTVRRGAFPWLPDFGGDQSELIFENLSLESFRSRLLDRLRYLFSAYIPFVRITDAIPRKVTSGDVDVWYADIRYEYRGTPGNVSVSLGGG
jgi:hypothetical protein